MERLSQLVEAALFSAGGPVSLNALSALDRDVSRAELMASLDEIRRECPGWTRRGVG